MMKDTELYYDWTRSLSRTDKFPIDRSSIFKTEGDLERYANSDSKDPDERKLFASSYPGQIVSVINTDVSSSLINPAPKLFALGIGTQTENCKSLYQIPTSFTTPHIIYINNRGQRKEATMFDPTPIDLTHLTGGGGTGGGIPEAPENGKLYGRKNKVWVEVSGGASIELCPNLNYSGDVGTAALDAAVGPQIDSTFTTINESIKKINKDISTLTASDAQKLPADEAVGKKTAQGGEIFNQYINEQANEAGKNAHAEGTGCKAYGAQSHAEGLNCTAEGTQSHAEGNGCVAQGLQSHAEGNLCRAYGEQSHAEGNLCRAYGEQSHAEGFNCEANGKNAHAEGNSCVTVHDDAHVEGTGCRAEGFSSHAEGWLTTATADGSHTQGYLCKTNPGASYSMAAGEGTETTNKAEFVCGRYNVNSSKNIFAIGNGTKIGTDAERSIEYDRKNILTAQTDSNIYVANVGGYTGRETSFEQIKSLQQVINDLQAKVSGTNDRTHRAFYIDIKKDANKFGINFVNISKDTHIVYINNNRYFSSNTAAKQFHKIMLPSFADIQPGHTIDIYISGYAKHGNDLLSRIALYGYNKDINQFNFEEPITWFAPTVEESYNGYKELHNIARTGKADRLDNQKITYENGIAILDRAYFTVPNIDGTVIVSDSNFYTTKCMHVRLVYDKYFGQFTPGNIHPEQLSENKTWFVEEVNITGNK